jgi:ankyrin repeat protein
MILIVFLLPHRFLLVIFRTKDICEQATLAEMREAARQHDTNPDSIYTRAFAQISNLSKSQATWGRKTIAWLTFCKETLDAEVLTEALAVEVGKYRLDLSRKPCADLLAQVTRGLVLVENRRYGKQLRLAHQTVQEHFADLPELQHMRSEIAGVCFTYLILSALQGGRPRIDEMSDSDSDDTDFGSGSGSDDVRSQSGSNEFVRCSSPSLDDDGMTESWSASTLYPVRRLTDWDLNPEISAIDWQPEDLDMGDDIPDDLSAWAYRDYPFSEYAADYAIEHLEDVKDRDELSVILTDFVETMYSTGTDSENPRRGGLRILEQVVASRPYRMNALHMAVLLNSFEATKSVHEHRSHEVNGIDSHGRSPLAWALILKSDPRLIRHLIAYGADLSHQDSKGVSTLFYGTKMDDSSLVEDLLPGSLSSATLHTALLFAAAADNITMSRALLKRGVKADSICQSLGFSALHIAASRGSSTVLNLFLESKPSPNVLDRRGETALTCAIYNRHASIAKMLLEQYHADSNVVNHAALSPLHLAMRRNSKLSYLLLEKGADPACVDQDGRTPLVYALESDSTIIDASFLRIVRRMATHDQALKTRTKTGQSALHFAVRRNSMPLLDLLLSQIGPMDVSQADEDGLTPLCLAVLDLNLPMVNKFLDQGEVEFSHRTKNGSNILDLAISARAQSLSVRRGELAAGQVIDAHDLRASEARAAAADEIALTLLQRAPDRARQEFLLADRALMHASSNLMPKLCHHLLSLGAQISERSAYKALIVACNFSHTEMIDMLGDLYLKHSWTPLPDKDGCSVLHKAVQSRSLDIVEKILNLDIVNIDYQDLSGATALYLASENGRPSMVSLIIKAGARTDLSDNAGRFPLDSALVRGDREIIQMLVECSAPIGLCLDENAASIQKWRQEPWFLGLVSLLRSRNSLESGGNRGIDDLWFLQSSSSATALVIEEYDPQSPYVQVVIPEGPRSPVRRIEFRTVSHDQGM